MSRFKRDSDFWSEHWYAFLLLFILFMAVRVIVAAIDERTETVFENELSAWSVATNRVVQTRESVVLAAEMEHRLEVETKQAVYDQAVKQREALKRVLAYTKEHASNMLEESEEGRFVADLVALFSNASSATNRSAVYSRLQQPELYGETIKSGFYQNGSLDIVSVEQVLKQLEGISADLTPLPELELPQYVAPDEPIYPPHPEEWEPDMTWLGKMGFFSLRFLVFFWWFIALCAHAILICGALLEKKTLDFLVSESIESDETSDNRSSYRWLQFLYLPIVLPARIVSLFLPVLRELMYLPLAGFRKYRHRLFLWKKVARWNAIRSHVHFHQMKELQELLIKAQAELKTLSDTGLRRQLEGSISELERSIQNLEKAGTVIDPESLDAREQMGRVAVLRGKIDAAISSAKGTLVAQKEVETVR